jgi:hypothetical protein
MLSGLERKLGRLGAEERRLREELISGFAEFVLAERSSERLKELGTALEELPKIGEDAPRRGTLEVARMRNLVRVLEDRARLREESVRSGVVEKALGVGRERLRQMREGGQILGIVQGERRPTLYPHWQFTEEGAVAEGLEGIVEASREAGMEPETLHFFMTEPNDRLGGERPVDLLRRGKVEEIARVLRSLGLGPF